PTARRRGGEKRRGRDLNPRRTQRPETVFETAAFDRSATPPRGRLARGPGPARPRREGRQTRSPGGQPPRPRSRSTLVGAIPHATVAEPASTTTHGPGRSARLRRRRTA